MTTKERTEKIKLTVAKFKKLPPLFQAKVQGAVEMLEAQEKERLKDKTA
ncbi:MAG: hypothetical protein GXY67_10445 [Clostridiales bacterium]|nr:hypothetical protein [Clostridiales bacterium]